MMMTGCGLKRGIVTGATDINGVDVVEKPSFNEQNLFATIFTGARQLIHMPSAIFKGCQHSIASTRGKSPSAKLLV
jgi:hypothetical protein